MLSKDFLSKANFPLEEFFQLSSDLMAVLDTQGRFILINPAFERAIVCATETIAEKGFLDFAHQEDLELVKESFASSLEKQEASTFVCRFQCLDKSEKWLLWRIYPKANSTIYAIGKDISPFRQLEASENARVNFSDALLDTVLAINSSLSFSAVLEQILHNVGRVVAYDHVSILLIEDDYAYIAAYRNPLADQRVDEIAPKLKLPMKDSYYMCLMRDEKKAVIVSNMEEDAYWTGIPNLHLTGSYLGSPIIVQGEVIGFLNAVKLEVNFYTSIHARQLFTFANQVAVAMNNALVYEQAKSLAAVEERQRLAAELHDSVSQSLYAANALASFLPKVIEKQPTKTLEYAQKISQRIQSAIHQMRLVLVELYPDAIIKTELDVLLKQLCAVFSDSTGLELEQSYIGSTLLKSEAQMAFYRIAQESLNNIGKHAKAKKVVIKLRHEGKMHILSIEDDGIGFDPVTIGSNQFGLKNLSERAKSIGADLQIESSKGTKVTLSWEER